MCLKRRNLFYYPVEIIWDILGLDDIVTHYYATAGKHLPLLLHDNNREYIVTKIRVEIGCYAVAKCTHLYNNRRGFLCGPCHGSITRICLARWDYCWLWLWQTADQSSRQRERPTSTSLQLSDSNKDLVLSPRWVLYSKTDWPTDRRS
jgi:hypothetical protein